MIIFIIVLDLLDWGTSQFEFSIRKRSSFIRSEIDNCVISYNRFS